MLEHFAECIKMSKGQRQEAIQVNVYTALMLALRTLAEQKSSLGQDAVKTVATELIMVCLQCFTFRLSRYISHIYCNSNVIENRRT
jgi:uncharacterized protein YbjQ (UPF0145 family)